MVASLAASHAKGKFATDKIFGAAAAAAEAISKYGQDKVVNATIGAILDDEERLVCLPTVEKVFRELEIKEIINYAPIAGLPDYLDAAIAITVGEHRPEAYLNAVATPGGSGGVHNVIANYTEIGDTVLTADWYWSPYKVMCTDALRKLDTYELLDDKLNFNIKSFSDKVNGVLDKQDSVVAIINTPAHNPTGYTVTDSEWNQIIDFLKEKAKNKDKKIILFVDLAYLDFVADKSAGRAFMKKFSGLPENILVILGFSMSKSYTMYGQRNGAMIGVSQTKELAKEFADINQYTCRATWSSANRACMKLLSTIYNDKTLFAQVSAEQEQYYRLIEKRADIFAKEAKEANLFMLPYAAGFFLSIPHDNSDAVCNKLHSDNIFAVPLQKGVRLAVCAIPTHKMPGIAAKIAEAMK